MTPPTKADALFRVSDLAVAAGGRALVSGFSLRLRRGEIVAVHGPSGCGKTTLLRALAGLIDPAAGEVLLEERPAGAQGWPAYRRRVLYVPQEPVMPEGSVLDQLRLPFSFRTARGRSLDDTEAADLLKRLRLDGNGGAQEASSLSVGQRQRVSLARALLARPAVLLLDEPTSALDEAAAGATLRLLRETAGEGGMAILAVLHDRRAGGEWADRAIDLAASGLLAAENADGENE